MKWLFFPIFIIIFALFHFVIFPLTYLWDFDKIRFKKQFWIIDGYISDFFDKVYPNNYEEYYSEIYETNDM